MKGNTQKDIENRTVEKIEIKVTIDKPNPMPMLNLTEIGRDNRAVVARNDRSTLIVVYTQTNDQTTGYVVDVGQIVEGILKQEGQK